MKAATRNFAREAKDSNISIHAAREGGDRQCDMYARHEQISIHAAREGGDGTRRPRRNAADGFQSTPPVKAATRQQGLKLPDSIFQSTPPVKAATLNRHFNEAERDISIHAAREGGDYFGAIQRHKAAISIHAAREGGDQKCHKLRAKVSKFQSTPPVKAATNNFRFRAVRQHDFNPRRP